MESPVGDSQTKFSARKFHCPPPTGLEIFRCCEIIKVKQNIFIRSISEFREIFNCNFFSEVKNVFQY